jgi:class 3 adenylate cyclase
MAWSVLIGIHVGPLTAGLLGRKRFQYDGWGDTVDLAARLHHHDRPGAIVLSESARVTNKESILSFPLRKGIEFPILAASHPSPGAQGLSAGGTEA